MTTIARRVVGGVDTHKDVHVAAVLDDVGRLLGTESFPTTRHGYRRLLAWLASHGEIVAVGVEGCGSWGAGLARYLGARDIEVVEVNRPNRQERRRRGKDDPIDAEAAARAVLAGTATAKPKSGDGPVEAVRHLRVARNGAVKARTAAANQLHALCDTAPDSLRAQLRGLSLRKKVAVIERWRPRIGHHPRGVVQAGDGRRGQALARARRRSHGDAATHHGHPRRVSVRARRYPRGRL